MGVKGRSVCKQGVISGMLPKTSSQAAGTVHAQFVRCGKPGCRCATGDLHGPYLYRFWRDEWGRLHKQYVRRADVDAVREACRAAQAEKRRLRAVIGQGQVALRWLARDGSSRRRPSEDIELTFSYPAQARALLDVAGSEKVPVKYRLRAMRSLVKWQRSARVRK